MSCVYFACVCRAELRSLAGHTSLSDSRSVLAGGYLLGWTPDVAVVLWQRMLGALGDVNQIRDPAMHAHVYEYFCDLMDILLKVRPAFDIMMA